MTKAISKMTMMTMTIAITRLENYLWDAKLVAVVVVVVVVAVVVVYVVVAV